jgi:hypothetical protein
VNAHEKGYEREAMAAQPPHTRLLNAAAREILEPLGLRQKGRSRIWLDDQGWWLGVVEFDHSRFEKAAMLNVGANLLWGPGEPREPGGWTMLGGRIDGESHTFRSEKQFAPLAQKMVERAAEEVEAQRERLASVTDAARWLDGQKDLSTDGHVGAGIALALGGKPKRARRQIDAMIAHLREHDADDETRELERLLDKVDDRDKMRRHVRKRVREWRSELGLGDAKLDL